MASTSYGILCTTILKRTPSYQGYPRCGKARPFHSIWVLIMPVWELTKVLLIFKRLDQSDLPKANDQPCDEKEWDKINSPLLHYLAQELTQCKADRFAFIQVKLPYAIRVLVVCYKEDLVRLSYSSLIPDCFQGSINEVKRPASCS